VLHKRKQFRHPILLANMGAAFRVVFCISLFVPFLMAIERCLITLLASSNSSSEYIKRLLYEGCINQTLNWWNELCVQNRQVFSLHRLNEKNMPYVRTLFKVQFIQDFGLFTVITVG
jgi:hypothetical protein